MTTIRLDFSGFKELYATLDPAKFEAVLRAQVGRATGLNAKVAEAAIRLTIKSSVEPKNAALTQAIKGSEKPLIDSAALWGNITSKQTDEYHAFVGTLRTDKTFNVAMMVHEGGSITVTPRMRGLFFRLWQASTDSRIADSLSGRAAELFERFQGWLPLNESTTAIVVPARPYIEKTFDDPKLKAAVVDNWRLSVKEAFRIAVANQRR